MARTLTRHRRRLRTVRLREQVASGSPRVDRAQGVIRGVKILGLDSANGRRYLPECIRAARILYEGRAVNANHPRHAADNRAVEDRFGWLEDVRVEDDGLYGDLHILLPKSDLGQKVMAAAEEKPDLFGLSHNAEGKGDHQDGVFVVEEITEVRSVDLVADPATTKGLFEEKKRPMKLKAFLEALSKKLKRPARRQLKTLLESGDYDDSEMEAMPMPPPGGAGADPAAGAEDVTEDPAEAAGAASADDGLNAAMHAILDDDSLSSDEQCTRMKDLLKVKSKHAAGSEPPPDSASDVEEEDDEEDKKDVEESEDDEDEKKKGPKCEAKKRRVTRLAKGFLALTEDRQVPAKLVEALVKLPDEASRLDLLESWPRQAPGRPGSAPRSASPAAPHRNGAAPKNAEEQAAALLR